MFSTISGEWQFLFHIVSNTCFYTFWLFSNALGRKWYLIAMICSFLWTNRNHLFLFVDNVIYIGCIWRCTCSIYFSHLTIVLFAFSTNHGALCIFQDPNTLSVTLSQVLTLSIFCGLSFHFLMAYFDEDKLIILTVQSTNQSTFNKFCSRNPLGHKDILLKNFSVLPFVFEFWIH